MPTAFDTPSIGMAGQPVTLTWTVKNQWKGDALPSWQDRVYLSTDDILDNADTFLTSVTQNTTVTVGSSYTVTQRVTLPRVAGSYYLILKADMYNQLTEYLENNNTYVVPFVITMPDLTPTG